MNKVIITKTKKSKLITMTQIQENQNDLDKLLIDFKNKYLFNVYNNSIKQITVVDCEVDNLYNLIIEQALKANIN